MNNGVLKACYIGFVQCFQAFRVEFNIKDILHKKFEISDSTLYKRLAGNQSQLTS